MRIKDLIKEKLEIIVNLEPQIENNIAISFFLEKIVSGQKKESFEVPINFVDSICSSLKTNNIEYKVENKNEYVKNIIKI